MFGRCSCFVHLEFLICILLSFHIEYPLAPTQIVCCRMTPLQTVLYNHFIKSKAVANVLNEDGGAAKPIAQVLPLITSLKKLCNHPRLVYDEARQSQQVWVSCICVLFVYCL
jgi:DNA repair and recombination RAD54-like protein